MLRIMSAVELNEDNWGVSMLGSRQLPVIPTLPFKKESAAVSPSVVLSLMWKIRKESACSFCFRLRSLKEANHPFATDQP